MAGMAKDVAAAVPTQRNALTKTKAHTTAKCAQNDASAAVEDSDVKHSHTFLHGGVIKSAGVVHDK